MEFGDLLRGLQRRCREAVDAEESGRERFGVDFSDVADAKTVELAVPGLLFGGLQRFHQVGGRLVAHPIQAGEQGRIQAVEIRQ